MKKVSLLIGLIIIAFFAKAQTNNFHWVKPFGSALSSEAKATAVDANGNIYTTGWFSSTTDFDPGIGVYNLIPMNSNYDVFILKQDSLGNLIWAKRIGGINNDEGNSIVIDNSGNCIVTGYFMNTVDFDPNAGVFNLTSSSSSSLEGFILKLDQNGNFVWARRFGGGSYDKGTSVKVNAAGEIFLGGTVNGPNITFSSLLLGSSSTPLSFVTKMTAAGNVVWLKTTANNNSSSYSDVSEISIDASNNVYFTGFINGTVDFNPFSGTYTLTSTLGVQNTFIAKLDASGNFAWAKQLTSSSNNTGNAIVTDNMSNCFIMGGFNNTLDFDPGAGVFNLSAGTEPSYLMKLDLNGGFIWVRNFGSSGGNSSISSMVYDNTDKLYLTGRLQGVCNLDPGVGTYTVGSGSTLGSYVSVVDTSGAFNSGYFMINGHSNDISLSNTNEIITVGAFGSTADFNPGASSYSLTAISSKDIFIHKAGGCRVSVPAPTDITPSINQSICTGQTTTLSVSGLGSFNWYSSPTSTVVISTNPNIVTSTLSAGTYTYYVESKLCSVTSSITPIVVTVTSPPVVSVSGGTICAGNNFTINPSGANTYTYSSGSAIVSPTVTQTYTITGSTGACNTSNTITVNVNASPSMTLLVTSTITCSSPSVSILAMGANTYTWTGSGIISGANSNVVNVNSAGIYTVTGSNSVCAISKTIAVVSNTVAPFPNNITSGTITCSNTTAIIQLNTSSSPVSCAWSGPGIISGANTFTPTVNISGTYTYTLSNSANGCTNTGTTAVVSNTTLPTILINSGSICPNDNFTLTPTGANTYSFSGGSAIVSPTATTNYTVTGTDLNGCSNTAISTVSVNAIPSLTISPAPDLNCLNSVVGVTCTATGAFTWTGQGISSGGNSSIVNVVAPGIYSVVVTDVNSCSNTGTVAVNSNTIMPIFSLSSTALSICEGSSVGISANFTGTNSVSYSWDTSASSQSISVNPTVPTTYTATVTDNINGCYSTNTITINVYALPNFTITGTNTVCIGTSTSFTVNGAMAYTWNTGQATSIIYVNPTVTTTYSVMGTDMNGCINSQTVTLTVDNTCADVWPGDANSDGLADNLDVLELGLHYTQTGAARTAASNSWQSYFANNWTGTITNGKNLNHSDCNGDGIINDDDTLAIYNNYGLAHSFKTAQTTTVNPQLSIVPDQPMVVKGMWGTASVYLGDTAAPINNINGLAFTIDFDNVLIEPNSIYLEYQNSFLDAGQNLHFRKLDFGNNKLFTATTHTLSNNVNGYGKIATVHYQILSGLTTDQVFNIGISQANQSDASGIITPLTSATGTLMAIGASVDVKDGLTNVNISISPNPTNGILNVSFNYIPQNNRIELYNSIGALVLTENMDSKMNTINLSDLSSGIYFIKVMEGKEVVAVRKVVKE